MINEAINCVHKALATPEDVDQMMKLGANHPMGPLSLADLIGLDIVSTSWRRSTPVSTTRSTARARS